MFDFSFAELFIVIAVGIFVIGPKDIPGMMRSLGQAFRRVQYIRYSMSEQFEKFMNDNDLNEIRHYSVDPMGKNHEPLAEVDEKAADEMLPLEQTTELQPDPEAPEGESSKKT